MDATALGDFHNFSVKMKYFEAYSDLNLALKYTLIMVEKR